MTSPRRIAATVAAIAVLTAGGLVGYRIGHDGGEAARLHGAGLAVGAVEAIYVQDHFIFAGSDELGRLGAGQLLPPGGTVRVFLKGDKVFCALIRVPGAEPSTIYSLAGRGPSPTRCPPAFRPTGVLRGPG